VTAILDKIYNKLPVSLQNLSITIYGIHWFRRRYGGVFRKELENCLNRSDFTESQWSQFQNENIRKILLHAFDTIPYYKQVFQAVGFTRVQLSQITVDQIQKLPILEKDTFRSLGLTELVSNRREPEGLFYPSSGSTGTPTQNLYSLRMHQTYYAIFEARVLNWAGLNYKVPRAVIGGRRILQDGDDKGPFYRYNLVEKQTYLSAYHLSPKTVQNYVEGIVKHKAEYLTGYASANYFLARFIEEAGIKPPKIKAILTSADKLTEEMRETFRRVYACEAFDSYNGVEATCLISECDHHRLHIVPDVGILEILNDKGEPCKPGETGEAVTTGLLNYDQPLIRYRMGDLIRLSEDQTCKCGRSMPLVDEIIGRIEDTVVGPDGREMVRFHGIFYNIPAIIEGQVIQHTYTDFEVKVVVSRALTDEEQALMKKRMVSQLGNVNVEVQVVDSIPRSSNGKFKAVISEVNRKISEASDLTS
jgi:phenylacetate-CoA ligase